MSIRGRFAEKEKLYLMLNLRIENWSIDTLAAAFHCDAKTIRNYCKEYGIVPMNYELSNLSASHQYSFSLSGNGKDNIIPTALNGQRKWKVIDGERINVGRSYADYLKQGNSPLNHA